MEEKTEWDIQMDMDISDEEDFIELTDIVKADTDKTGAVDDHPDLDLDPLEETISHEMDLDVLDLDDHSGADIFSDEPEDVIEPQITGPETADDGFPSTDMISPEQVEAALERVIEKKFAQKIESILFEVMERVIEKEIAEIRATLQKDLDNIGKV